MYKGEVRMVVNGGPGRRGSQSNLQPPRRRGQVMTACTTVAAPNNGHTELAFPRCYTQLTSDVSMASGVMWACFDTQAFNSAIDKGQTEFALQRHGAHLEIDVSMCFALPAMAGYVNLQTHRMNQTDKQAEANACPAPSVKHVPQGPSPPSKTPPVSSR